MKNIVKHRRKNIYVVGHHSTFEKLTALHPKSCTRDMLTCRAFNTSRYHEPRLSKHRHDIPHNNNHIAININHERMNMSYAQTLLT